MGRATNKIELEALATDPCAEAAGGAPSGQIEPSMGLRRRTPLDRCGDAAPRPKQGKHKGDVAHRRGMCGGISERGKENVARASGRLCPGSSPSTGPDGGTGRAPDAPRAALLGIGFCGTKSPGGATSFAVKSRRPLPITTGRNSRHAWHASPAASRWSASAHRPATTARRPLPIGGFHRGRLASGFKSWKPRRPCPTNRLRLRHPFPSPRRVRRGHRPRRAKACRWASSS